MQLLIRAEPSTETVPFVSIASLVRFLQLVVPVRVVPAQAEVRGVRAAAARGARAVVIGIREAPTAVRIIREIQKTRTILIRQIVPMMLPTITQAIRTAPAVKATLTPTAPTITQAVSIILSSQKTIRTMPALLWITAR